MPRFFAISAASLMAFTASPWLRNVGASLRPLAAQVTVMVMGVKIPPVRMPTSPLRKDCCVSTTATPDGHFVAVSTVGGGTRP